MTEHTERQEILLKIITKSHRAGVPWPLRTAQASHSVLKSTSILSRADQELHGLCRVLSSLKNIKRCMVSVIEMIAEMRLSNWAIQRPITSNGQLAGNCCERNKPISAAYSARRVTLGVVKKPTQFVLGLWAVIGIMDKIRMLWQLRRVKKWPRLLFVLHCLLYLEFKLYFL